MVVGCYHGLNLSSGLLPARLILPWDACVVILSNIESSHMLAGHLWALEPGLCRATVLQLSRCCSYCFILSSPRFWLVPMVCWFGGRISARGLMCITPLIFDGFVWRLPHFFLWSCGPYLQIFRQFHPWEPIYTVKNISKNPILERFHDFSVNNRHSDIPDIVS